MNSRTLKAVSSIVDAIENAGGTKAEFKKRLVELTDTRDKISAEVSKLEALAKKIAKEDKELIKREKSLEAEKTEVENLESRQNLWSVNLKDTENRINEALAETAKGKAELEKAQRALDAKVKSDAAKIEKLEIALAKREAALDAKEAAISEREDRIRAIQGI